MAIDKTLQTKRSGRGASMDSIKIPENLDMSRLERTSYHGSGINAAADEIFSENRYGKKTRFGAADVNYAGSEQRAKQRREEAKTIENDFTARPMVNNKARNALHQGVKVGSSYVERKKIIIWITAALILLASALVFLPPLMNSSSEEAMVDYDRNVFRTMGMTEFKAFAMSNYSVFSQEAFSSERNENYRVIEMTVHLQNSSPFEVTIPQYEAVHVPAKYKDKVCYVTSTGVASNKDGVSKVVGDRLNGFEGKDVTIEMMINVADMTEEDLDECVTGMILSTTGAKKRIARGVEVPCLPAFLFVSDAVTVQLDP